MPLAVELALADADGHARFGDLELRDPARLELLAAEGHLPGELALLDGQLELGVVQRRDVELRLRYDADLALLVDRELETAAAPLLHERHVELGCHVAAPGARRVPVERDYETLRLEPGERHGREVTLVLTLRRGGFDLLLLHLEPADRDHEVALGRHACRRCRASGRRVRGLALDDERSRG